jgi:hypothetical protein
VETLDTMPASTLLPRVDWRFLERQAQRMLGQWRELLTDDVADARRVLRELLEGPLRFTPLFEGTKRGYRFEGAVTIGQFLAGNAEVIRLASPGRIELPA